MRREPHGSRAPEPPDAGPLELFCACAPGLEGLLADELRELGLSPAPTGGPGAARGGVLLRGSLREVLRINLRSRLASRVLVRLGSFVATKFDALVAGAAQLPFEQILAPGAPLALRVTCKKSRLYHSGAVAERIHQAVEQRVGRRVPLAQSGADEADAPEPDERDTRAPPLAASAQLLVVRFEHDACTISADASGPLLHRRGYRTHASKAPLRETLAAALLRAIDYRGGPLVDPCCGAGTIPLEAALVQAGRAPNPSRAFACDAWPAWSGDWISAERRDARAHITDRFTTAAAPGAAPIQGFDLDPRAVEAAQANAKNLFAPQPSWLRFATGDLTRLSAASLPRGCAIAANPPYGERVGEKGAPLLQLWSALGKLLRESDGPAALLAPMAELAALQRALDAGLRVAAETQNGGLRVAILARRS